MINTIHDLITSIKEKGISDIEPFLNIQHNPTIGDMYEGLTKEIVSKSIFNGFDLRVASGKVKNIYGELSRQIDCMIVVGEGDLIPFTNDYIYEVNNVIAVIEVKKNLFSSDLHTAFNNLRSVSDIAEPNREMDIGLLKNAFEQIAMVRFPEPKEVNKLSTNNQLIYHSLIMECFLPARIIFGYSGFCNEQSLRTNFIKYMGVNKDEKGQAKGFGAVSLPNLIICGDNALVKTNGFPYVVSLQSEEWVLLSSYSQNPLLLFLEIIWTKLSNRFSIDSDIFGYDMHLEYLNPLLKAIPFENGWMYHYIDLSDEELRNVNATISWEPVKLSVIEFCLIQRLCNGEKVYVDDESLLEYLSSHNKSIDKVLQYLKLKRLIYIDKNQIKLLTKQCLCMITPEGYFAGENKDGKMIEWSRRQMKKKNK